MKPLGRDWINGRLENLEIGSAVHFAQTTLQGWTNSQAKAAYRDIADVLNEWREVKFPGIRTTETIAFDRHAVQWWVERGIDLRDDSHLFRLLERTGYEPIVKLVEKHGKLQLYAVSALYHASVESKASSALHSALVFMLEYLMHLSPQLLRSHKVEIGAIKGRRAKSADFDRKALEYQAAVDKCLLEHPSWGWTAISEHVAESLGISGRTIRNYVPNPLKRR